MIPCEVKWVAPLSFFPQCQWDKQKTEILGGRESNKGKIKCEEQRGGPWLKQNAAIIVSVDY